MNNVKKNGHQPRKRFGQNFLQSGAIVQQIISAIDPQKNDIIVEIGPGLGALTDKLVYCKQFYGIELDKDLHSKLEQRFSHRENIKIIQADALNYDFLQLASIAPEEQGLLRVIGNLPYNISTPLLFHLMSYADIIGDMYFMLQKEIVDRITAKPFSKSYGRLSIVIQAVNETEKILEVPPSAFWPTPKVDSAVIRLQPKQSAFNQKHLIAFNQLVKTAFQQRRKTLRNNLKLVYDANILALIDQQLLTLRPEALSVSEYIDMFYVINTNLKRL